MGIADKTILVLGLLAMLHGPAMAHSTSGDDARLPMIGPAPDFSLTSQDGATVSLNDYRGRVVAVTFIFTSCIDSCPLLTAKMARVQEDLGEKFGEKIAFISITVDPQHDTPEMLKAYAETFGADLKGWAFLTGAPAAIEKVGKGYGIYAAESEGGGVDHTFLTSIIDRQGNLRVQYLGVRFNPDEFEHDLLGLLGDETH
jgi:protein SCO1